MATNNMNTSVKNRDRDSNFCTIEIETLLEYVKENLHILENKKTDSTSSKAKKQAWEKIAINFHRSPGCKFRGVSQLESKWKGLKAVSLS